MSKKMLINASHPEENRVAIVVDGILSELDIEIAGQEQSKGNIYKAVVVRVETGLQAAFVDYGAEKLGFLQIGEIHPNLYPKPQDDSKRRPRIAEILQHGQEILVQIVKEERGNKGAALTTNLSIPGRYMVLMPDSTTKGVSRKISLDSERRKLKKTMAELELPERMGYIVRTAGIGKDKEELKRDFDYLVRLFEGIIARKDQIKAPAQLYQESNLAIRSIRDYFSTEMDEVLVDDGKIFQDTKDFFSLVMPELKHLVKRHRERRPIFSRYQIEEQIEGLSKNQSPLPSGGSIVIDQTEALVAIDVNSGKMSGESGIEQTAFKTNMEAAVEVGRQLRLRDLGGLIVIDFIDMRDRKNIREVEHELRKSLKDDKAKVSVGRISQFGLMEMSRQRLKPVLSVGAYRECPHCKGIGRIKSVEAQAIAFLRQAHTAAAKGQIGHIEAKVPLEVANHLLNQKRSTITELERQLNLKISLIGCCDMIPGDMQIELQKREKQQDSSREIAPVSHDNQIEIALAAAQQDDKKIEDKETPEPAEQENSEEVVEKSKNRRRRRRKKPAAAQEQPEQQTTPDQQDQAADPESPAEAQTTESEEQNPSTASTDSAEVIEEKPKPRRRGRRKAPANKVSDEKTREDQSVAEEPSTTEDSNGVEDKTTEKTDKPKRRPRRNTKKATTPKEESPVQEETPQPESPVDVKPAEKPQRRTRRTTKKAAENMDETQVSTPSETEEKALEKLAEKPKRRPRKTTKKVETPEAQDSEATPEVAEDKEKPQPRQRRTTKKTAEKTVKTPEGSESESEGESKPKRRTRRTTKKVAEPTAKNETTSATVVPESDEVKKPQQRRRRATKKSVDPTETDKSATAAESAPEEKPKKRTRRAPAKKKPPEPESTTE